jgi:hypothetical protein
MLNLPLDVLPSATAFTVGGTALGILLLLLICMVAFGGGREHS